MASHEPSLAAPSAPDELRARLCDSRLFPHRTTAARRFLAGEGASRRRRRARARGAGSGRGRRAGGAGRGGSPADDQAVGPGAGEGVLAVDALDADAARQALARGGDQRRERRLHRRVVGRDERQQRAAAALQEQHRPAVDQHDVRRRRCARRGRGRARATASAAPYGLAGSAAASTSVSGSCGSGSRRSRSRSSGARHGELRAAEALDEVAAPRGADRLQRAELAVDRAVAARLRPRRARPCA